MSEQRDEQAEREEAAFAAQLARTRPDEALCTYVLLAGNLGMFAALLALGAGWEGTNIQAFLRLGAVYRGLIAEGEYWRLLSAAFLHFGVVHLAFNMWALWDVGRLAERLFGTVGFLLIYAACAALGGAASILVHGDEAVSAGASGAIFGLCGGLGALMLRNMDAFPRTVLKRLGQSVGGMVAYSLFLGFTKEGIDNAAHIGGLLGGVALGFLLSGPVERPLPARPLGRWALGVAGAVLVIGYITYAATHRDPAWEAGQVSRRALAALGRDEDRLAAVARQVLIYTPNARLPADIEARLVRPWEAIAADLAMPPSPGLEHEAELARRYALAQAAYWHLYATEFDDDSDAAHARLDALRRNVDAARWRALHR